MNPSDQISPNSYPVASDSEALSPLPSPWIAILCGWQDGHDYGMVTESFRRNVEMEYLQRDRSVENERLQRDMVGPRRPGNPSPESSSSRGTG